MSCMHTKLFPKFMFSLELYRAIAVISVKCCLLCLWFIAETSKLDSLNGTNRMNVLAKTPAGGGKRECYSAL